MIHRRVAAVLAATVLSFVVAVAGRAEPPELASLDSERHDAFFFEQQFFHRARLKLVEQFRHEILPNFLKGGSYANETHSYVTEIELLRPKPGTDEKLAVVVRYDYSSGLTFQTTIDLNQRQKPIVQAGANRPTLLATPEVKRAADLVTKQLPGTSLTLDTVSARPINDDATTSKSYGHRLVVLWQDQPDSPAHYLVDLTTDELLSPNY